MNTLAEKEIGLVFEKAYKQIVLRSKESKLEVKGLRKLIIIRLHGSKSNANYNY